MKPMVMTLVCAALLASGIAEAANTVTLVSPPLPVGDSEIHQAIVLNLHGYAIDVETTRIDPNGGTIATLPCPSLGPGAMCGADSGSFANPGPGAVYLRVLVTAASNSLGVGVFKRHVRATLCNLTRNICVEAR